MPKEQRYRIWVTEDSTDFLLMQVSEDDWIVWNHGIPPFFPGGVNVETKSYTTVGFVVSVGPFYYNISILPM